MKKKVFNWPEVHLSEVTSYKIHILAVLVILVIIGCLSETPFSTLLGCFLWGFPLSIKQANKQSCNANLLSSFQEQEAIIKLDLE